MISRKWTADTADWPPRFANAVYRESAHRVARKVTRPAGLARHALRPLAPETFQRSPVSVIALTRLGSGRREDYATFFTFRINDFAQTYPIVIYVLSIKQHMGYCLILQKVLLNFFFKV